MGQNKALIKLNGESLLTRAVRRLSYVCAEVAISGSQAGPRRAIPDRWTDCGPLGGIVSALEQTAYEWNLFLAVDMPLVPEEVLRTLLSSAGADDLVVLAESEGKMQPLCGVYSRRALPILRDELQAGRFKVKDAAVATGALRLVRFESLEWFKNLNTPEDFKLAQGFMS